YLKTNRAAVELAVGTAELARLKALLCDSPAPAQWKRFFFNADGHVRDVWHRAFVAWGHDPAMQKLQLDIARQLFWTRAMADAKRLRLTTNRALCLLLDIAVQNGGW